MRRSVGNGAPGSVMTPHRSQMLLAMGADSQHKKKSKVKVYETSVKFILVSTFGIKKCFSRN